MKAVREHAALLYPKSRSEARPAGDPAALDAATIKAHCADLAPKIEAYRAGYVAKAKPFLTALLPEVLPRTVVYPFGGGFRLSAGAREARDPEWRRKTRRQQQRARARHGRGDEGRSAAERDGALERDHGAEEAERHEQAVKRGERRGRRSDLPPQARAYLDRIEDLIQVPIRFVSVGHRRDQIIT